MPSFCTIALDIGGTKIAYGLIPDSSPTTVLAAGRIPTQPVDSTAQQQVQLALRTALESAATKGLQPVRVGIGAPGVVDTATGLVTYAGRLARHRLIRIGSAGNGSSRYCHQ